MVLLHYEGMCTLECNERGFENGQPLHPFTAAAGAYINFYYPQREGDILLCVGTKIG